MVFEKLISSIAKRSTTNEAHESPMMKIELEQGIEFLNVRAKEIRDLTNQLALINNEGFTPAFSQGKPLDKATQRELDIVKTLEQKFESNLSTYGNKYRQFMENYNKYVGLVNKCQQSCNGAYPVGSSAWSYNRQACKAGCQLKGPYASKCENKYKSLGGSMNCSGIAAKGVCSGGSVIPGKESQANNPAEKDSQYNNTYAEGCCVCGGGSGGPPKGEIRGTKITSCESAYKPFGYSSPNYTVNACNNAPYASPEGAANLWREYNSLVGSNNELMKLAQLIYKKIDQLSKIDSTIKQNIKDKENILKNQLKNFETTYAQLKSVEGSATQTLKGIVEDVELRNRAVDLSFYPWALLAISGVILAIYQIKKA